MGVRDQGQKLGIPLFGVNGRLNSTSGACVLSSITQIRLIENPGDAQHKPEAQASDLTVT